MTVAHLLRPSGWATVGPVTVTTAPTPTVSRSRLLRVVGSTVDAASGGAYPTITPPIGARFVRYEDLLPAGVTYNPLAAALPEPLQATLNRCTGNRVVTFPEGTFEFSDFGNGYIDGIRLGSGGAVGCGGISGSGHGTVFRMKAGTSTHAADGNVTTGTNNCYLLSAVRTVDGTVLENFRMTWTDQGAMKYWNGLSVQYLNNPVLRGLYLDGVNPGWLNSPPGETFAVNVFHGTGATIDSCDIDGRNPDTGVQHAGALLGLNNTTNVTVQSTRLHHSGYSHGLACYYADGTRTFDLTADHNGTTSSGNVSSTAGTVGVGVNHEQSNDSAHTRLTLGFNTLAEARYYSNTGTDTKPHTIDSLTLIDGGPFNVIRGRNQTTMPTLTNSPYTLTPQYIA